MTQSQGLSDVRSSRTAAVKFAKRAAKRIIPLGLALYVIPVTFAVYVGFGLADFMRNKRRTLATLAQVPVYAGLVVVIVASGVRSPLLDTLAVVLLAARVLQTVTHVAVEQTDAIVGVRFAFFFTQIVCMAGMGILVALRA